MSTITKELAKLFRKITNSEIDAEGNAHVVLSPADSLLINNARIALASLEAEAVACIDLANLDYLESGADADVWPASGAGSDDVLLYAAPQLPQPAVFVPSIKPDWMNNEFNAGWNACRTAMLQDGNSPETHDELSTICSETYQVIGVMADALGAFNDPTVLKVMDNLSQQKLVHSDVLPFSLSTGNHTEQHLDMVDSGWIPVSDRMPEEGGRYWCYVEEQNSLGKSHYQWNCSWNGEVWSDKALSGRVTHWMPLPAAPQQGVKSALEHGMQRYAGAMQKLSEGDD